MCVSLREEAGGRILIVQITGQLTQHDYAWCTPVIERLIRQHGEIRMLILLHELQGWSLEALWEDMKLDCTHFAAVERLAFVGNPRWETAMKAFCKPFATNWIRYFDKGQLTKALDWVRADIPHTPTPRQAVAQPARVPIASVALFVLIAFLTPLAHSTQNPVEKGGNGAARWPAFKAGQLDNERDALTRAEERDLRRLVYGTEDAPVGARRRALMEKACRWYIYRLTSPTVQSGLNGTVSEVMEEILGASTRSRLLPDISHRPAADAEETARRKRQWAYAENLRPLVIAHVQKVMELDALIARLNALRILHALAQITHDGQGNEEVVAEFIRAIENPHEHDAVRLWAIRGIHVLVALQNSADPSERIAVEDQERMYRALAVTLAWLQERMAMDPALVAQMREEERDGISYVRRAAIRVLGEAGRPFLKEEKDQREGPVALVLTKLISIDADSLASPSPTWLEAVEAAHALCQLQPELSPSYQPEFVAYQLARFVAALGAAAGDDVTRESERWEFFGFHLHTGLETLVENTPANRGGAYVKRAAAGIDAVLENLMDSTKNNQAAQALFEWTKQNPPTAKAAFSPHQPQASP